MRSFDLTTMTAEEHKAFEAERHCHEKAGRRALTPRLDAEESSRVLMWISEADWQKIEPRRQGVRGVVRDLDTGALFTVTSAPCRDSAGSCYCDMVASLLAPET